MSMLLKYHTNFKGSGNVALWLAKKLAHKLILKQYNIFETSESAKASSAHLFDISVVKLSNNFKGSGNVALWLEKN